MKAYLKLLKDNDLLIESSIPDDLYDVKNVRLTYDSRDADDKTLFVCKGSGFKPEYLEEAIGNGILAYVSKVRYSTDVPYIIVSDEKKALALMSALYTGYPDRRINMLGVGGTKGKTTTTYYIKYILDDHMRDRAKPETAILSSVETYDGVERKDSVMTTPESLRLHEHIKNAVDSGIEDLVMEVSSQALKTNRTYGITYDVGIFLNISEDHISEIEHKDYEDYISSKLKLFDQTKTAVVCADTQDIDRVLNAAAKCEKVITFGMKNPDETDLFAYDIKRQDGGTSFRVRGRDFDESFFLTMPGLFNVENALAAIAAAVEMNVPIRNIKNGLKNARVSGRMEVFRNEERDISAIVDYAHNKLSFESLYRSIAVEYPEKRIITVFGATGGHARNRRKDLGELAARCSSMSYLTTDDPRYEEPEDICAEIAAYMDENNGRYKTVVDRCAAIKLAISEAEPGSVILVVGKGNEDTQYIKGNYVKCMSDVECVKKYLI